VSLPWSTVAREREHLEELAQLATTAGAVVAGRAVQARTRIDGATFIGAGKARMIGEECVRLGANLLIFDDDLSPAQAHNLEKILGFNVIDRTELILDIFARHAKTQQSKIQVELAQLQYALPRLRRMWEHLSRQAGGIGSRGPGETQLEVDRRRIHQRMGHLRRELSRIGTRRETLRRSRNGLPVVALVGYTNAGKSSLMRQLTGADALVRDQLFATLDTMTRRMVTRNHGDVLLVDTVGFIRKLPDHLVTSFKATLEDTAQADLYLHVVDLSHGSYEEQMAVTDSTMATLDGGGTGTIHVFNKIDRMNGAEVDGLRERYPGGVFVSARDGTGVDILRERVEAHFYGGNVRVEIRVGAGDGRALARVRSLVHDAVVDYQEDICVIGGSVESRDMGRLEAVDGASVRYLF
jgi:GTP-binding protein HflX